MIKRTIEQIESMIQIENDLKNLKDVFIQGVSIDSRKIEPGNLFVPFKGDHSDGHRFVEDAIKNGAAAALWQKRCTKSSCRFADHHSGGYTFCLTGVGKKLSE